MGIGMQQNKVYKPLREDPGQRRESVVLGSNIIHEVAIFLFRMPGKLGLSSPPPSTVRKSVSDLALSSLLYLHDLSCSNSLYACVSIQL